jgi:hypothetical protein
MEKSIGAICYWLGLLCLVLSVLFRLMNIATLSMGQIATHGNPVGFRTFLNGAEVFFLAAIASAGYSWLKGK